ncbi:MAG TPA: tRNA preQ1(34) S-adenosylmethionine ribosyltransferase-isomerase QueA [Clostridia bacterium]|nr:tRNA preQ1(34) S-adenosylmethionine ribosyltransferase-isomerase QueA [Clostridia bacterium]
MRVDDFDFFLPPELIAQTPLARRDDSRLLVLPKNNGLVEHKKFYQIVDYLIPGDTLVLNNTKVIPARLFGKRADTNGKIEVLLLKRIVGNTWETLVKPGRRAKLNSLLVFGDGRLLGRVKGETDFGGRIIDFEYEGDWHHLLDELGQMPLPPYITAKLEEKDRYQTVYAQYEGSAAAPTAGLHFTPELIEKIKRKGVNLVYITLHVGLGTFRPIQVENVEEHRMHEEFYQITPEAAGLINQAIKNKTRIIAVGTTSVRTLESAVNEHNLIEPGQGWTNIFIYPGYQFKVVDGLITNFHLPKSTLIMLVCALAGKERVMAAYKEAIRLRYRFYSFGDAMLII